METQGKLILTKEQARDIVYDDNLEFETVSDEMIEKSRWSILNSIIIKRISDGALFRGSYRVGATEQQDERPFEYDEPDFHEVVPKEVITIKYVRKYPPVKAQPVAPAIPATPNGPPL